jgi:hypothetical protein
MCTQEWDVYRSMLTMGQLTSTHVLYTDAARCLRVKRADRQLQDGAMLVNARVDADLAA